MADDKIKKEMGVADRSITSVKNKKVRLYSPYGVVEADTKEQAQEKLAALKAKAKSKK